MFRCLQASKRSYGKGTVVIFYAEMVSSCQAFPLVMVCTCKAYVLTQS